MDVGRLISAIYFTHLNPHKLSCFNNDIFQLKQIVPHCEEGESQEEAEADVENCLLDKLVIKTY